MAETDEKQKNMPQESATPDAPSAPSPSAMSEQMPTLRQLAVALGILLLILGASYIPGLTKEKEGEKIVEPIPKTDDLTDKSFRNAFADVDITAEAAYVWDVRERRALYNKNAAAQLPYASLTKLMTALVVYETLENTDTVTITFESILQDGDSNFIDGEKFLVQDLLDLTLVASSNDGAYALAAASGAALGNVQNPAETFVGAMNRRAEEIGMTQSYFTNPTGLDESVSRSGSYGSARDIALLMEYLITNFPVVVEETARRSGTFYDADGTAFDITNTNLIVSLIPGLIGSKTGYTDLAGGNLVVAFDAGLNRPVIVSVMGSTERGRFYDVAELVRRTQRALLSEQQHLSQQ